MTNSTRRFSGGTIKVRDEWRRAIRTVLGGLVALCAVVLLRPAEATLAEIQPRFARTDCCTAHAPHAATRSIALSAPTAIPSSSP